MHYTTTQLQLLNQLSQGNNTINTIAQKTNKSTSQIYRAAQKLTDNNTLTLHNGTLQPTHTLQNQQLLTLLQTYPNLIPILSHSGLHILSQLLTPKTLQQLITTTQLKKSTIYQKLKQAHTISLIKKTTHNTYTINTTLWPELTAYLKTYHTITTTIDSRIPINSTIYKKNKDEILYSTTQPQHTTKTAYSRYKESDIPLLLPTTYYYQPNTTLSIQDILNHSIIIAAHKKEHRTILYLALYYLKHKKTLPKQHHPIIKNIENILKGKTIPHYPTKKEITQRAEMYDIRF